MKDQRKKSVKTKQSKKYYLLESSEKVINKNFVDLSVSISGDLVSSNAILLQRHFNKPYLELF